MQPHTLYKTLHAHFGPRHWWPLYSLKEGKCIYKPRAKLTDSELLEISLGAILTQNTAWKNVEKALGKLKPANAISARAICKMPKRRLASLISSAGCYNQKASYLKNFCSHIVRNYKGSPKRLFSKPKGALRAELLSLKGIGNETADSIVCYAAQKPSFVIDAYTLRFIGRFYGKRKLGYVEAKAFFESQLPKDTALFNDFHAQFVELGKRYCKPRPRCCECFLRANCRHAD